MDEGQIKQQSQIAKQLEYGIESQTRLSSLLKDLEMRLQVVSSPLCEADSGDKEPAPIGSAMFNSLVSMNNTTVRHIEIVSNLIKYLEI